MMERIEGVLPPVHLCAGWGLSLTASRRMLLLSCRLLRLVTPFLALGGRHLSQTAAARSVGLLTAMPWLAPRWLEKQERVAAPNAGKQPMPPPMAAAPTVVHQPVRTPSQQQAQPLIALALSSPFSGDLRTTAASPPAPAEPAVYLARIKRETSNTGMGAFPQTPMQPQVLPYHTGTARQAEGLSVLETEKQTLAGAGGEEAGYPRGPMPPGLQKMALSWDPLAGFRGFVPGTSPASPGHGTEHLFRSPPAAGTQEWPPLPEHRLHGGPDTVAPGTVSPQGLSLLLETIGQTMKREVAAALREREEKAQPLASNRSKGLDMTAAEDLVSDDFVRLFMQKMCKQAEEERFRLGLLR